MSRADVSRVSEIHPALPGRFVWGVHLLWLGLLIAQLGWGWVTARSLPAGHLFLGVAVVALAIGAPLFHFRRPMGWVLFFVGNFCIILHFAQGFLLSGVDSPMRAGGAAAFAATMLLALIWKPVLRFHAGGEWREWARAPRFPTWARAEVTFHGRSGTAVLLDISRSGCSFASKEHIPVGEVTLIGLEGTFLPEAQVARREAIPRESLQPEALKILEAGVQDEGQAWRYGARFRGHLDTQLLIRLSTILHHREEEFVDRNQTGGVPADEDP